MKLRSLTLVLAISLVPSVASAHAALGTPTPRSADDGLTVEPCGGLPAGAPMMFMANETITVSWSVGQTHGGFLQIDFAAADDVFDGSMILATDIPDTEGSPTSMDVTLPDIACDACTLRLIQINEGKSNYVSCADVQLIGGGGTSTGSGGSESGASDSSTGGGSSDSGGSSSGGPVDTTGSSDPTTSGATATATATAGTMTTDGGSESSGSSDEDDAGGCGCTSGNTPTALALGLLGLLALRRRKRR